MKKEESFMGIISLILGLFSIFTIMHGIGFYVAVVSLALAIPSVLQKKKSKVAGVLGFILSLVVVLFWILLPRIIIFLLS
jgi:hypothetical protein